MEKITESDWRKAEKKWSPGEDHDEDCTFCLKFSPIMAPSYRCIGNGCPLANKGEVESINICCDELWWKWSNSRNMNKDDYSFDNGDDKCAAAVLKFIQQKHKEWKKAQK